MESGRAGFTLIEMAIVLVIIGLIVGGVLVGQDLIKAAYVRAQISQIEKFNTAVNTFFGKYQALPGDMNATTAQNYGFSPRGTLQGQGDGNGILEGSCGAAWCSGTPSIQSGGETAMFWVDLSSQVGGGLIEGGFSTASETSITATDITGTLLNLYLPAAKIGEGNYVYAWSVNGINYYGLSNVYNLMNSIDIGVLYSYPGITVKQAYNIDRKVDDGYPVTGRVTAMYLNFDQRYPSGVWPWVGGCEPPYGGTCISGGLPADSTSCFDNNNGSSTLVSYSLSQNGGAGLNCALSFQFQAGD